MSDFPSEEAVLEPKRIQVFAILHIVFGGVGVLSVLGGMVMTPLQTKMMDQNIANAVSDEQRVIYEVQKGFYDAMGAYNWVSYLIAAVVAGLILTAGIMLLKRRATGLKVSNAYAWTSIGAKLLNIVLFFLLAKPALDAILNQVLGDLGSDVQKFAGIVTAVVVVVVIISAVLGMIYPFLVLKMLNKEMVRRHLK